MSTATDQFQKEHRPLLGLKMPQWLQSLALKHLPVAFLRRQLAKAIIETSLSINKDKQLLIDVSVIVKADAKTGIQRVVRNLYQELLVAPPAGYRICPIAATRKQGYYYLDTDFLQRPTATQAMPVNICTGDLFLGLDLAAHIIPHRLAELLHWKRQGVRMSFFIYDLLPVLEPTWFNPKTKKNFLRWLRALALLADDTIAISRTVQSDFATWMLNSYGLTDAELPCATIQLGAELNANHNNQSTIVPLDCLPPQWAKQKFILMVGTIEPRKGHEDILDAIEPLWAKGEQMNLVIAGKQGWKVESFIQRLQTHPDSGLRLHWLDSPSDELLLSLYQNCRGLIMASKGEGFGLPLIEAAYFNKPVFARDIPVFREVAGNSATFFTDIQQNGIVEALACWFKAIETGILISRPKLNHSSWKESCTELIKVLQNIQIVSANTQFSSLR